MSSPIHHTFGPLADTRQCLRALAMLLTPWTAKRGGSVIAFERSISETFRGDALLFASGREALFALLKAMKLRPGEEVIIQGYTCVVVPNAIHAAGGLPVYADIDRATLNASPYEVEKKISPRTRAVICQHTFGIPSDTKRLKELCEKHHLIFIEDCAHILPDTNGPEAIGRDGDALILSFGRDKAISGVAGGAVVTRHEAIAKELQSLAHDASDLPLHRIERLLLYPLLYALARPLYGLTLGKALLASAKKLGLLLPIVDAQEKEGSMLPQLHRMPNALAFLARAQWQERKKINDHRRMLTNYYREETTKRGWPVLPAVTPDLPLQKFPLFFPGAETIRKKLKKKNIYLDDGWTGCVVCPASSDLANADYVQGTDPHAEETCERILSLPTHPGMTIRQAQRLMEALDVLI